MTGGRTGSPTVSLNPPDAMPGLDCPVLPRAASANACSTCAGVGFRPPTSLSAFLTAVTSFYSADGHCFLSRPLSLVKMRALYWMCSSTGRPKAVGGPVEVPGAPEA